MVPVSDSRSTNVKPFLINNLKLLKNERAKIENKNAIYAKIERGAF